LSRELGSSTGRGVLAGAVRAMAAGLKQVLVAEGGGDQLEWAVRKVQRCDEGQGCLFGRPIAAEPFTALLARNLAKTVAEAGDHPGVIGISRHRGSTIAGKAYAE